MSLSDPSSEANLRARAERGPRARWWLRKGSKKRGFYYEDIHGSRIDASEDIERIRALVIPPAWRFVRISPSARSNIQAVGIDAADRLQYLYSVRHSERRQLQKFARTILFGERLPMLRERTNADIMLDTCCKTRVLAVMTRLMNDLYFRAGSEKSVSRYRTFGITTLRNRHLEIQPGGKLQFNFVGKHHIRHRVILVDADLAAVMREIKSLSGSRLFNYITEDGSIRPVTPRDLNAYIGTATSTLESGVRLTSKDFRTWGATLLAALELAELGVASTESAAKKNIVLAVRKVAERLGNTPAVCRSSYIHPTVIKAYEGGHTLDEYRKRAERTVRRFEPGYEVEEMALLRLLRAGESR